MKQSNPRPTEAWTIRRAALVDVPAVSRLLGVPHVSSHPLSGSSDEMITSATRLVLTHVALDLGEFWVAVDDEGHLLAAVVLLPSGGGGERRVRLAVRQELGLLMHARPEQADRAGVPDEHWLLLPAVPPEPDEVIDGILAELLEIVLSAVDRSELPVLSVQQGPPSPALIAAGFAALPVTAAGADSEASDSAALRPALPTAIPA